MESPATIARRGRRLWLARGLLLLAPFAAAIPYEPLRFWALQRWPSWAVAASLVALLVVYVALWHRLGCAQRSQGVELPAPGSEPPSRRWWWLGLLVGALFCCNAGRFLDDYPASIDSEARDALRMGQIWLNGAERGQLWQVVKHRFGTYNVGLGPLMFPVVAYWGPNPVVYKWVNAVYFAVLLAALAVVFGRLNLPPAQRWLVLLLPLLSIPLPSLQMYRWHCVCLVGTLALIQAAGALEGAAGRFYGSLAIFCLCLTLYHGQMLYQAGLIGLALWQIVSPTDGQRRWGRVAGLLGCAAVSWCLYAAVSEAVLDPRNRGVQEVRQLMRLLDPVQLNHLFVGLLEAPGRFAAWPILGLFVLGVAETWFRAQRRSADRMALLLGGVGFVVHLLAQPIGNAAWRCWYLLPFLWIGLNGVAAAGGWLIRGLPARLGPSVALLGLVATINHELVQYEVRNLQATLDSPSMPWNTSHQLDRLFRHFSTLPPEPEPILHLIPGRQYRASQGGFSREMSLAELDWRGSRVALREFENDAQLVGLLQGTLQGRLRHRVVVVYLSQLGEDREWNPEAIQPRLKGLTYTSRALTLQDFPLPAPLRCLAVTVRAP